MSQFESTKVTLSFVSNKVNWSNFGLNETPSPHHNCWPPPSFQSTNKFFYCQLHIDGVNGFNQKHRSFHFFIWKSLHGFWMVTKMSQDTEKASFWCSQLSCLLFYEQSMKKEKKFEDVKNFFLKVFEVRKQMRNLRILTWGKRKRWNSSRWWRKTNDNKSGNFLNKKSEKVYQ